VVHGRHHVLFLFLVETITGVLLMFYYRPTVEFALHDIKALREHVPARHHARAPPVWGAHAMVHRVWLHMLRVFLTGSYKPPREFNWNVGVNLLVLTLLSELHGLLRCRGTSCDLGRYVGSNMARATGRSWARGAGVASFAPDR
jgi:quinol-cytochrome oxidoreductase complex cytochrome b subunit